MDHAGKCNGLIEREGAQESRGKAYEGLQRRHEERTAALERVNKALQAEINERKELEEKLQEEKNRLQSMADAIEYGLTIQDRDYNTIYQNKFMVDTFGRLGEKCYRAYEGKDKICDGCPVEMAYRDGKSHTSEREVVLPSGEIAHFENTANPIRNARGEIATCLELVRDITERKRAEKAIRESEQRFRDVMQSIDGWLWEVDENGAYTYCSEKCEEVLGYSPEDMLSKTPFDFMAQGEAERITEIFSETVRKREPIKDLENWNIRKEGTPVCLITNGLPILDEKGELKGYRGINKDISWRVQAEKEVRENEDKYRTLLENLPQKIFHKNRDLVFMSCNKNYAEDLHIKPEEIKGKTTYDFYPKKVAEEHIEVDKRVINTGKTESYERKTIRDGQETWTQTVKTPVKDDKGNILGLIGIFWDITDRKRIEEERVEMIKELEKRNVALEESTQKLREATVQLVQSEKLSALGELTAGVAHEINQPLNGIKIISQSLLRDMERNHLAEDELADDLKEIVNQVNKMAVIIDHMRIYARSTDGPGKEAIDINGVIDGPFKLLDQQLRNHNVEVVKEYALDLPKVTGDPIRLEQVFMNLITNARNALDGCGKEDKRLVIRTYKTDNHRSGGDTPSVAIEVKDNGGGIPEDLREKIFQPFFTTKEPGQGTGLGLSVASRIIEEHRGKIEMTSKVGEGTTFSVILPIAD